VGHYGPIDHLVFTGSTAVGRQIALAAGEQLLPTTLELSGRDSALVLDDADPLLAAQSIWTGVTVNSGQTCTAPRRALVDRRIYPEFLAALAPLASGARPCTLISPEAAARCFEQAKDAVETGGERGAFTGKRGRSLSGVLEAPSGRQLRPLVIADCPSDAKLVEGDHFGPVIAIVPVDGEASMLAIHDGCDQHLSASIFTRRPARAAALAPRLHASFITVNQCLVPLGHPGATFGGTGASGWGLSRGREGLLAMTRPVTLTCTSRWIRPPLGEPSRRTIDGLSRFLGWIADADSATTSRNALHAAASAADGAVLPPGPSPSSPVVPQPVVKHKSGSARSVSLQDQSS
jgi:aldehyde dehydrogenase (NAD+)